MAQTDVRTGRFGLVCKKMPFLSISVLQLLRAENHWEVILVLKSAALCRDISK